MNNLEEPIHCHKCKQNKNEIDKQFEKIIVYLEQLVNGKYTKLIKKSFMKNPEIKIKPRNELTIKEKKIEANEIHKLIR